MKQIPQKPNPRAKVLTHTYNPSLWDAEAAESEVHSRSFSAIYKIRSQPGLYRDPVLKTKLNKLE